MRSAFVYDTRKKLGKNVSPMVVNFGWQHPTVPIAVYSRNDLLWFVLKYDLYCTETWKFTLRYIYLFILFINILEQNFIVV
jgi:hypothetical protein